MFPLNVSDQVSHPYKQEAKLQLIIIVVKNYFSPLLRAFRDFVYFPTSPYLFQSLTCSIVFYLPTPCSLIASFFSSFLISTMQFVSPQCSDRTLAHNRGSTRRGSWHSENTSFLCENGTLLFNKSTTCVLITTIIHFNLLQPPCYVMHQQFNVQQFYILPTLYLCVSYLSQNKQRLVPLTA